MSIVFRTRAIVSVVYSIVYSANPVKPYERCVAPRGFSSSFNTHDLSDLGTLIWTQSPQFLVPLVHPRGGLSQIHTL